MPGKNIIISIQPRHAAKIFAGIKTVELRRTCPKHLVSGALALVYVSSPIKCLAGAFKIDRVIERPLTDLWKMVRGKAGVTRKEFYAYYERVSVGTGIFFKKVWRFSAPLSLPDLREEFFEFSPPQAFRYAQATELEAPKLARLLADIILHESDPA